MQQFATVAVEAEGLYGFLRSLRRGEAAGNESIVRKIQRRLYDGILLTDRLRVQFRSGADLWNAARCSSPQSQVHRLVAIGGRNLSCFQVFPESRRDDGATAIDPIASL